MRFAKHRFVVLDAWRGFAACQVALFHFLNGNVVTHFDGVRYLESSALMVDFFFVLSGFVISHAAYGKITDCRNADRDVVGLVVEASKIAPATCSL